MVRKRKRQEGWKSTPTPGPQYKYVQYSSNTQVPLVYLLVRLFPLLFTQCSHTDLYVYPNTYACVCMHVYRDKTDRHKQPYRNTHTDRQKDINFRRGETMNSTQFISRIKRKLICWVQRKFLWARVFYTLNFWHVQVPGFTNIYMFSQVHCDNHGGNGTMLSVISVLNKASRSIIGKNESSNDVASSLGLIQ